MKAKTKPARIGLTYPYPFARFGDAKRRLVAFENGYLWIGNDDPGNSACYLVVSGKARLRKLARAILAVVGEG